MVVVRYAACAALAVLALAGCAAKRESASPPGVPSTPRVAATEALVTLMEGRFSSAAQAERDPDYRDIRLSMTRIWKDRADGPWMYVEQAVAGKDPYRQRVYHLIAREDGLVESAVLTLPKPEDYVGAAGAPERFSALSPSDLVPRTGCSVFLAQRPDGTFAGGTRGTDCPSELRGATYATSEAVVGPEGMTSWDRGYDAEGRQVWGAEKAGYEFVRVR